MRYALFFYRIIFRSCIIQSLSLCGAWRRIIYFRRARVESKIGPLRVRKTVRKFTPLKIGAVYNIRRAGSRSQHENKRRAESRAAGTKINYLWWRL
jgi:hypothetical protein